MKLVTLIYGIIPLVIFTSCSTGQHLQNFVLQEEVPFEIVEYYYQDWPQHTRTSPAGIHLTLVFKENLNSIELKDVYFKDRQAVLKPELRAPTVYVGKFSKQTDRILDADPVNEYGNEAPQLNKRNPFEVSTNDAIISYTENGRLFYYKLINVEERGTRQAPRNPR
jgi:hypothetical protein